MRKTFNSFSKIFLLLLLLTVLNCKEEIDPIHPILFTGEVTSISEDGVIFTGIFKNTGVGEVIEYGVVWSTKNTPTIVNDFRITKTGAPTTEIEQFTANTALNDSTLYYVRSYVAYEEIVYYGNPVQFLSLGSKKPVIKKTVPNVIFFGDTIEIIIDNIDYLKDLELFFNKTPADILTYTDSSVNAIVPSIPNITTIKERESIFMFVKVFDMNYQSNNPVVLSAPHITLLNSKNWYPGDIIDISCENLLPNSNYIFLDGIKKVNEYKNQDYLTKDIIKYRLPIIFKSDSLSISVSVAGKNSNKINLNYKYPSVDSVSQEEVTNLDTVTLYGENLEGFAHSAYLSHDLTLSNSILRKATVFNKTNTRAQFIVPRFICGNTFTIIADYSSQNEDNLDFIESKINFKQPLITTVQPSVAKWGENITIKGTDFPFMFKDKITIQCNDISSEVEYSDTESITFKIPSGTESDNGNNDISLIFNEVCAAYYPSAFTIPAPIIDSIRPFNPAPSEQITVYGKNFNNTETNRNIYRNVLVLQGNIRINPKATSTSELIFTLPSNLQEDNYTAVIETNSQTSNQTTIDIKKRWNLLTTLPTEIGEHPICFAIGENIYIGGGFETNHHTFYKYNTLNNTFTQLNDMPSGINSGMSLVFGNTGYILQDSLYAYQSGTDSWQLLDNPMFSFKWKGSSFGIANNDQLIATDGIYRFSTYDINNNAWDSIEYIQPHGWYGKNCSFNIDNKFYIFNNYYYAYILNESSNWVEFGGSSLPYFLEYIAPIGFEYSGLGFIFIEDHFIIYNPVLDNWSYSLYNSGYIYSPQTLRIGDKAYVISGSSGTNGIWEFLFNRPE